jgi:sulfatase maturation enzyme AslB (radical SAM superfamily)
MVFIVQQANNFCAAPWIGLYYHSDSASSCCAMSTTNGLSPKEYLESEQLKELKQDFIKGKQSTKCDACWVKDRRGLVSIRQHFVENFPNFNYKEHNQLKYMELRESNLCNFACRMCNANDSVKIEREINDNPELLRYFAPKSTNSSISEENWKEIFELSTGLDHLYLTGGEPLLMKRYYDLMDHLIAHNRHETIRLKIYTNCSVFNPVFIDKLVKFKRAEINMSIDAVGKVAEYQRYGTDWDVVRANIFKFAELPIRIRVHSTISAYTLLDMSALADLFLEIRDYEKLKAKLMIFNAHVVRFPVALDYANLNYDLRVRAINEIDAAIKKLSSEFIFKSFVEELVALRKQLIIRHDCDFKSFVDMTKALDKVRNQSFEEVFGYKI